MSGPGKTELMALALADHLRDGEIGFIGVGSSGRAHELVTGIPIMATKVAQSRGIDFDLQIGPLIAPDLDRVPEGWFDNEIYKWSSPALIDSDTNMDGFLRGEVSVGFISGAQIDRYGNVNVSRIKGSSGWKRLGGALALPEHCAFAGRAVLLADLNPRIFVEEVDFVTGFGHRRGDVTRDQLGLPGGGPSVVITDKAVFDFADGEMRLTALYPGVTPEEVEEGMGFVPARAEGLAEMPPPPNEEIELLKALTLPALPY